MSVLSFCVKCVNHNDIPLEAIAKFFYGQRVGIVTWIDVVEYVEVSVCGAHSQENYRRLYVHFETKEDLLERSDIFIQELIYGNNNWKLTCDGNLFIEIKVNKNQSQTKHHRINETTYAFNTSNDVCSETCDKTRKWDIYEILGDHGLKYNNLHEDKFGIFQYIEDSSFEEQNIVSKTLEEGEIIPDEHEERRVDLWNPVYDFHNKYTSYCGAIGFTKENYKYFYGDVWKHYWDDSTIWEKYFPNLRNCMALNISITIGPFFSPHSGAMKLLIVPIKERMNKIENIYYDNPENRKQILFDPLCKMETERASYFVANMKLDFTNLNMNDFYTIKNYLLDIEHMCEVLKPKNSYNSIPETRIYINFD